MAKAKKKQSKEEKAQAKLDKQAKADAAKAKAEAKKQKKAENKAAAAEKREKAKRASENKVKKFGGLDNGLKSGNRYMRWGCTNNCNAKFLVMDKPISLQKIMKMDDAVVNKILHCNPLLRKVGRSCKSTGSSSTGSSSASASQAGSASSSQGSQTPAAGGD